MGGIPTVTSNTFDEFCRAAVDFLAKEDVPYLIVGGLAVAVIGAPRFTADIDVVAFVTMASAERLIAAATAAGFLAGEDEVDRLRSTGTLRFLRGGFHLDVIVASLPFEERARHRAVIVRMFNRDVPLPTPEDLLLFKIISGREKDVLDAVGIAHRHGGQLDWPYVTAGVDEICDLADQSGPRQTLARVRRE